MIQPGPAPSSPHNVLRSVAGGVQAVLFPPVCLGCPTLVSRTGSLCARCWPRLALLEEPWCDVLGTPFAFDHGEGAVSGEALAREFPFARARAAVAYDGLARILVQSLKYRDRTDLAPWLAEWMVRAGSGLRTNVDLVVPVPLHRRRFFSRRFNQAAELGRAVGRLWDLPFEPGALTRRKATRRQVGLGSRARTENVRGAFAVPESANALLRGRRVLLVDDVFTTGATVGAATRALLKGGAAEVSVLTFARVVPEGVLDGRYARDFHGDPLASI